MNWEVYEEMMASADVIEKIAKIDKQMFVCWIVFTIIISAIIMVYIYRCIKRYIDNRLEKVQRIAFQAAHHQEWVNKKREEVKKKEEEKRIKSFNVKL